MTTIGLKRVFATGLMVVAALAVACGGAEPTQPAAVSTPSSSLAPEAAVAPPAQEPTASPATQEPTLAPPAPAPTPDPFLGVPGIVDPLNHGWPREVEGLNGLVVIEAKPLRIITASVGHDEMTLGIVPLERLVGVGTSTKNILYSNVAEAVQSIETISRDPEVILAQSPDIVVTSPFLQAEVVDALVRVGVTVVQTDLKNDAESRINNILLLGYIYGEEDRAVALAAEVQARFDAVTAVVGDKLAGSRPRVISLTSYSSKIYTAGDDSTEGGVIVAAGGVNAAAEAGLTRNPTISLESIISMAPDLIFIPQPGESAEEFMAELLENQALAEVPAIKSGQVYIVNSKLFTTLSFWNLLGVEELARLLWSDDFADLQVPPFTLPE